MRRRVRRALCALAIVPVVAACGTTVQTVGVDNGSSSVGTADGGLSVPSSPGTSLPANGGGQPGGITRHGVTAGEGGAPGVASGSTSSVGSTGAGPAPGLEAGGSHGPIQLGVLYAVNDGAQSAGVNNGDNFALGSAVRALVTSYNKTGGIGGRRIDPIYAEVHSASNDYESQIQAACASFTQDHHVAAVVSNTGYFSENLLTCLSKASVPMVSGDWAGADKSDARRFPLFVTPDALLGEIRMSAVVRHLAGSGFLTPSNRIGVVIEDCPIDQRVYQSGLLPALHRAGLTVAATTQPQCFQAIQNLGSEASNMQSAVLQFRQHRVDRVMFVSQAAEGTLAFLFMEGADAQHWTPGYGLSFSAAPAVLAANASAAQLANAHGVGWLPALDTQNTQQLSPTSAGKACLARMKRQGIQPSSNADYADVYGPCDSFALFDMLLRASHGEASAEAILNAVRAVGRRFVSASTVDGRESLTAGRIGAAAGRLFAYVSGKGFEYTSAPFPL